MTKEFIFILMAFLHIVDDFYMQNISLTRLKQKKWWEDLINDFEESKYNKDYIAALIVHGFSWSFMVHLPILLIAEANFLYVISVIAQGLIHAYIDDVKANKFIINLIEDQTMHISQIVIIFVFFVS